MIGSLIRNNVSLGTVTASQVLDGAKSNAYRLTLGADLSVTLNNLRAGDFYALGITQDGTGGRVATIPGVSSGAIDPAAGATTTLVFVALTGTTAELVSSSSSAAGGGAAFIDKTGASPVLSAAAFELINLCDNTVTAPTLPEITSALDGQSVIVSADGPMTIAAFAGDTVDGAASYVIAQAGQKVTLVANFTSNTWLAFPEQAPGFVYTYHTGGAAAFDVLPQPVMSVNQCDGTVPSGTLPTIVGKAGRATVVTAGALGLTITPFAGQTVGGGASLVVPPLGQVLLIADEIDDNWDAVQGIRSQLFSQTGEDLVLKTLGAALHILNSTAAERIGFDAASAWMIHSLAVQITAQGAGVSITAAGDSSFEANGVGSDLTLGTGGSGTATLRSLGGNVSISASVNATLAALARNSLSCNGKTFLDALDAAGVLGVILDTTATGTVRVTQNGSARILCDQNGVDIQLARVTFQQATAPAAFPAAIDRVVVVRGATVTSVVAPAGSAAIDGLSFTVKNRTAGSLTVTPSGGDTFDGNASYTILTGQCATFTWDQTGGEYLCFPGA